MQVNIVCKDAWQKITVDEWDVDPNDMKMTVKCLPTFKYDLPSENFPKVNENPPILNIVYIPISPQKWLNILPITFFQVSELLPSTWPDMEQHRYGWHHRPPTPGKIFFFVTINNFLINIMIIIFQREFALNPSVDVPHPTDPVVGYKWVSLIMILHLAVVIYTIYQKLSKHFPLIKLKTWQT